jgi:bifunctional DNase/RNase
VRNNKLFLLFFASLGALRRLSLSALTGRWRDALARSGFVARHTASKANCSFDTHLTAQHAARYNVFRDSASAYALSFQYPKGTAMLRMKIEGVGFDHRKQTVVVLKDWDSEKRLPIWIGAAEARSIALQLEGTAAPRPLAHDLLMNCIRAAGGRVVRVVINDLQDGTFYATVDIDTGTEIKHIDSRPSDAIALAVRADCPVFVDGGALEALIEAQNSTGDDEDEVVEIDDAIAASTTNEESTSSNGSSSAPTTGGRADDEIDRFKRLVGDLDL